MIDFIEYVVSELKSKRLSKTNAVALVRQFSHRPSGAAAVIHPLLHLNTSDLSEQRYCSTFTGQEHFLTDHQVKAGDSDGQKVLPGVAYLEMARAAVEHSLPERPAGAVLELRNTVWAQPVVVGRKKDVSIALLAIDDEQVDYEIYSEDEGQEFVHCQGRAVWNRRAATAAVDLERLDREMTRGSMAPETVYAICARMGLVYGPSFRSIKSIRLGDGQLLAELRLPSILTDDSAGFVLHPSLMDGALQAAVGLLEGGDAEKPRLPFALETLRVLSPCTPEMVVWLRHAAGSRPSDKVVKLDIDLCAPDGKVCVEIRGISWRVLSSELGVTATGRRAVGNLLATPVWQARDIQTRDAELAECHVLSLQQEEQQPVARDFGRVALACFEQIRDIFQRKPQGKVLVQVVVPDSGEEGLFAGLSGLFRTAALENPQFTGQVVLVSPELSAEESAQRLEAEKRGALDPIVRYRNGVREVLRWQEVAAGTEPAPIAFVEQGVYLITGGFGGLGLVFAGEILEKTSDARVVLTGRAPLSPEKQAALDALSATPGRVTYRQLDLGNAEAVRQTVAAIREECGRLDGILHSAGMIADDFILKKESSAFSAVLEPKVTGTLHLDEATRDVELDFFVLFSAVAGAMGNLGQADYAAANSFMDHFAAHRNRQVAAGRRKGRTRAIDWPLWQAGGMVPDAASRNRLQQTTGMQPMHTATGLEAFHRILALPYDQMLVVEGDLGQIRRMLSAEPTVQAARPLAAVKIDSASLAEKTQEYLRNQFSGILQVPAQRIDPRAALENYGIDSIVAMQLTNQLETVFGSLSKTLFFEYQTIRDLADYFIASHAARLAALFSPAGGGRVEDAPAPAVVSATAVPSRRTRRRRNADRRATGDDEPIAIIGLSGRYPEAIDVEAYWKNLRDGRDCITEVPKDRWDWREYFSEDRSKSGHHYSKWGGFIEGVDEFDPLFFNISPVEAEAIDPQERLFLQHAWMAIEDAGYTRAGLQIPHEDDLPGQVGVYAGVMYTEYQMFGAEALARGKRMAVPGSAASIANRVSYALNLHGPSMTLDTMCSSSLTAIHLACQDLKHGRTSLAIAGGVNVSIHPNKYLVLSEGQFISSDGHCESFGEGGGGYIPGEGVGVVVLKRLSDAKRDGDHIYGIIRGSALTHGGKTNGYSVPNPQAQASTISRALAESGTDARHISYIEAHGTGTKLGDPIEIAALNRAFQKYTPDTGYCLIGSAKSNIGHCESAAGIAGLTKVLLQMQHGQIVPSLHSARLNPHIDFPSSPFVVNQTLRPWETPVVGGRTVPRIAGISSFGAGGSNAHLIVEEYVPPAEEPVAPPTVAIVLSARTAPQLRQKAGELLEFLRPRAHELRLGSLAYTLQVGREAMDERLGLLVSSTEELVERLERWLASDQGGVDVYRGQVKRGNETFALFNTDPELQQAVEHWIAGGKLSRLLELWVKGLELDWSRLYGESRPRRISLPVYPFARERYWIDTAAAHAPQSAATAVLHPLLHSNTSDLSEQRYSSTFTGEEPFLADHRVKIGAGTAHKVLPGVVYLEMARAAIERALPERPASTVLELHDTVWAQPVLVDEKTEVGIVLSPGDGGEIDYEIHTGGQEAHCQGRAVLRAEPATAKLEVEPLRARMQRGTLESGALYEACARLGLIYGPSFQAVTAIHRGAGEVLAELQLPDGASADAAEYTLHPSMMDGALQAAVGLLDDASAPAEPRLPFALETLRVLAPCTAQMLAWVRVAPSGQAGPGVVKLDVDLCDAGGNVCVQMRGFSTRALAMKETGTLAATPFWQASELAATDRRYAEHHVILCELPDAGFDSSLVLPARHESIAQRYEDHALACFERIQSILVRKPEEKVLVQVAVPDHDEQGMLAGLSALLTTAALENPQLVGQLVLVPRDTAGDELSRILQDEANRGLDPLVRYGNGVREVVRWQEIAAGEETSPAIAFQDDGVYLITGGLGALGALFAEEILTHTRNAKVVLTSRSARGAESHAGLPANERVAYRQVDLGDVDQVAQLVSWIGNEWGRLDGILHCAGMIADGFIVQKTGAQFRDVLAPKVAGTWNLDQATRDVELDFFVLFSSIAGASGNPGQADYSAANAFMDRFAAYRNGQVTAGARHGRTRSINWPLWQSGGMGVDGALQELLWQTTGMRPMETAAGVAAFHRALVLPYDQTMVVEGDLPRLRRAWLVDTARPSASPVEQPAGAVDADGLAEKTQEYLRRQFAGVLKLPSHKIDPQAALEEYGIDSILAMKLTSQLEKAFGSLPKTLFFEYQTIAALAEYFVRHRTAQLVSLLAPATHRDAEVVPHPAAPIPVSARRSRRRFSREGAGTAASPAEPQPVAIIGLSGRYPQAFDLDAFWNNLREGKDCITEVPKERWDWREFFSEDRTKAGHHYSKWGGFIEGVDEFDPLFFNISPVEAEILDPQERLFLQHSWMALEDAGYTRAGLQTRRDGDLPGQVGVYAGVMYNEYQLFSAEANARGRRLPLPGSSASIANRVSYVLNLHGPSVTLDTMCSSSLTAIHFACQDLALGRTDMAIAGGVNVTIHPNKYLVLSAGQFISSDGHCQSFGEGGDGYIPGEGVGVVILKRLSEARRDGDHIYGVIRGSAINHGGKTNGYTVPNPQAQASAISTALAESRIDARHISYIEAHGTGTTLGDPIEIAALGKAFQPYTQDTGYCLIGSAKSNIGHCESAAGIAGLTKVLLQLQHREIVPSLHSSTLNPHIDFASTPFVVNQALRPWDPPVVDGRTLPRVAGISSFGAGGSNAHLIVEEDPSPEQQPVAVSSAVVLLSARTPEQLQRKTRDLLAFLRPRLSTVDLAAMAFTLQVGREPMEERLAFVVSSAEALAGKLEAWLAGEDAIEDCYQGQVKRSGDALSVFSADADLQQMVDKWFANGKVTRLLDLWVQGLDVDWNKLHGESRPRRMSLPAYPFARDRHWIDVDAGTQVAVAGIASAAVLHPLLHSNTSDLNEQRYRSLFTGDEFFLTDHRVTMNGVAAGKVLPGVAYLEMARAAIEQALPERPESTVPELRNVVWAQPIVIAQPRQINIALSATGEGEIEFEIYSRGAGEDVIHSQGRAVMAADPAPARLDLEELEGRMVLGPIEPDAVYAAFARMGLSYGPAFRTIAAIHRGPGQVLAHLRMPASAESASPDYVLHPSVMDGALQAAIGLLEDLSAPNEPRLPFELELLRVLSPCTASMVAWVRLAPGSSAASHVVKLDIDLCDDRGNVSVQMRGLCSRVLSKDVPADVAQSRAAGSLLAAPVWLTNAVETFSALELVERHTILCELADVEVERLATLLPLTECLSLQADEAESIATRYSRYAAACFEQIQSIFRDPREGNVLVQLVIADDQEHSLFAGLSGLLKTAALENPQFIGQLILVPAGSSAEDLERYLNREMSRGRDALVKYRNGVRRVLRWQEVAAEPEEPPVAFKDGGVYLITGGVGGLGLLFAAEILERTRGARVVLTGRSALTAERQALLDGLPAQTGSVSYRELDLMDAGQVEDFIAGLLDEYGRLDGILHAAGMIADRFILHKDAAELLEVLAPKVTGTVHLDHATRDVELDFFVLFSSVAGAMGNPGQADYAAANGFMDQFAAYRDGQVAAKQRHGRTRSVNWPLWQHGGMKLDRETEELLQQTTGMSALQTATGLRAFHRSLALPSTQLLVVEGDLARLRGLLLAEPDVPAVPEKPAIAAAEVAPESLPEKTQDYLREELSGILKVPAYQIDVHAALEKYGIDSILAVRLTNQLEKTFGPLSKTLFFEYQTIAALGGYFIKAHSAALREKLGFLQQKTDARGAVAGPRAIAQRQPVSARRNRTRLLVPAAKQASGDIAIIGLAGRYPQAENLLEFWSNLKDGRDCITEVPADRWDHSLYFDPDPSRAGKSYTKWGGFIADVDKFDPLFFNISPREAELIDPQERLFMETAWETIEDAGYTREKIAGRPVGVFVGVMWGHYELFGAESVLREGAVLPGSSYASIANRVSYFFDLRGPSIALDTMCSSSLTAIHLACEALRRGEIEAAIAGGVNVSIHPYKYLSLSQGKFAATDGRCRSFGAGGDGYVPGEGVGAVLLKPLEQALLDGDQIYATIKSSSVNHGGKTNGYTVPNPNAQGGLIRDALAKANIDPQTLGYIETHGTGTSLGDPIEVTGLLQAFEGSAGEKQSCPIGSVKSNIGHLEAAAGIAALTKALLQLRYGQLVPSLHADPPNPNINFADSPFYVQTELADWARPVSHPRRVGVSSFGAGGANAHLILEESPAVIEQETSPLLARPETIVLSAKNADALLRYAERIVRYLDAVPNASLADMAYTFQVGRTPMDARLAVITSSTEKLRATLEEWIALRKNGDAAELQGVFQGNIRETQYSAGTLIAGPAGKAFLDALLKNRDLERAARLWVLGADIDWSLLERDGSPRRVSLPTYPFAKERYWIRQETTPLPAARKAIEPPRKAIEPVEEKRRISYVPQWTARALASPVEPRPAIGTILLLDTSEELFTAWSELPDAGTIVLVKLGDGFTEIAPDSYAFDFTREEHFQELVAALDSRGLLPDVVLHHATEPCDLETAEDVARQLDLGVFALFHLCRALMAAKRETLRVLSLFAGAPLGAAIAGFLKTLALEAPSCGAKTVEIAAGLPLSEKTALILDELRDTEWRAQEIRYRDGARSVRKLVPQAAVQGELPLRRNGVYLLTGGLGGLGILFAEYLAKNYQARLILTGRTAPNALQQAKIERLKAHGAEVLVLQADVARRDDVEMVVRTAKEQFLEIHGVIHAAGVTRDAFLLRKTREEIDAVLAAKVYGTIHLDLATAGESLDFFALFASVAGVTGNIGQCDYAFGNRFLDAFAESRARTRSGRTLSIDWPFWTEGGMRLPQDDIIRLERQTGLMPLPTQEGLAHWEELLRSDATQAVALYGAAPRIAAFIDRQSEQVRPAVAVAPPQGIDPSILVGRTEAYLKAIVGEEIKLAPERIGSFDPLESFGIDSVMINSINAQLASDLGELPKTLLYEHETIRELAAYLVREAPEALLRLFGSTGDAGEPLHFTTVVAEEDTTYEVLPERERDELEPIAIIGMHGDYPHSATLADYWENLKQGRDLIDLVPPSRWDAEELYHPDPAAAAEGKIYCKWGGFLEGHDQFDPHFFKISTTEAALLDPQERLFLQSVWAAIEDAGYTRDRLRTSYPKAGSADVGVFVGVTTNSYHLWAAEERTRGNFVSPMSLPWSIANRVSYFFDFNGPSLPVDTACSSSLVALHLACESLRNRECQVAVAGGVNLYLHPAKYQSLCQKRMLSAGGKCYSYGAGDDGFVPGEGVGTVVLKPLSRAIADRDRIHAVIRASAFDHSGRSNGYSAPNPNAQAHLISRTLEKARIHPETIGYVEGHGTGTQLGDSIEVAALTKAFRKETARSQFCSLGSVKANIGHAESAAGIAGLAKVVLQMQHGQLAPSIHSDEPNPNIELESSPFYLQHGLSEWQRPEDHPRRALINSFGAGGLNACVVVEEYTESQPPHERRHAGPYLFALSAKTEDRLHDHADRLLAFVRNDRSVDLASLCYTLQTGREAMEERLAIVVADVDELVERLGEWSEHLAAAGVHRGSLRPRRGSNRSLKLVPPAHDQSLADVAAQWVAGEKIDWEDLYLGEKPRRIAVPTYPFARERYWLPEASLGERSAPSRIALHPLIAYNSSTLDEVRFSSSLPETIFCAADHKVGEHGILPGAAFLELACVAANMASEQRVRKIKDVLWMQPLSFRGGAQTLRTVLRRTAEGAEYVISSFDDEHEQVVHSEGRVVFGNGLIKAAAAEERMTPQALKTQCSAPEPGSAYYDRFRALGLNYGPSFQTIQEVHVNHVFALSKLKIADERKREFGQFILHPSMIDGALQTIASLVGGQSPRTAWLPFALDELEILGPVPQACYAYAERADAPAQGYAGVAKFNIRLLNESGETLVKLRNLYVRPLAEPLTSGHSSAPARSAAGGRLLSLSGGAVE